MSLLDALLANAAQREAQFLRRFRRVHQQRDGAWAMLNKQRVLNFSSNDYLGFAQHPDMINAFKKAADQYGVGSAGSALVSGYFGAHQAL